MRRPRPSAQWTLDVVPAGSGRRRAATATSSRRSRSATAKRRRRRAALGRCAGPSPPDAGARRPATASRSSTTFTVLGTRPAAISARDDFLTFIRNAENGVKERGMFEGRGPLAILLLVLLGGLALNLTPCVLPMIPINLAIIGAGAQAGSRGRGFLLGGAYGAAMALVYGVLGLVVILTAGTFGTINASPWFNLGIARAVRRARRSRCSTSSLIDFSRFSSRIRSATRRAAAAFAAGVRHGRRRGAARRRLRRAGRHPGRAVLEQPLRDRHDSRAGAAVLSSASAWRFRGRSPAPASRRCRSRACGWCASSRRSASSSWRTAAYYGYEAYALFANRWVDPAAVDVERRGTAEGRLARVAGRRARRRAARAEAGADRHVGHLVQELPDDGQDDARRTPTVQTALAGYVKIKFQAEDPDAPPAKTLMQRFDAVGLPDLRHPAAHHSRTR